MSHNICSHRDCKNDNKNVSRWELTDSRGYSCVIVCNDCHQKQKSKYNPIIFQDPHDYLQYMAECGENIDNY